MQGMTDRVTQQVTPVDLDERQTPRFTLLIRTGKLVVDDREYLCIIRDLSATGASIRGFHPVPPGSRVCIEFQNAERHAVELVWSRGHEAGFEFLTPIDVEDIVAGYSKYPKRDLRFAVDLPVTLTFGGRQVAGRLANISRQGGNLTSQSVMSIDQPVTVKAEGLPDVEARVRWRKEGVYGLVFDTTFSLGNLATLISTLNHRKAKSGDSGAGISEDAEAETQAVSDPQQETDCDQGQPELPF